MDLIRRALRRLIPAVFGERTRAILDALSGALGTAYAYLRQTLREANAGTADDTLAQWYAQLSIPYDERLPLKSRQLQARQAWVTVGGQAVGELDERIQIAFPGVSVTKITLNPENMCGEAVCGDAECENYPSFVPGSEQDGSEATGYYFISGDVEQPEELDRLIGLLDRTGPAELEPVFQVTILSITNTSQTGVATCGLAECNAE